MHLVALVGLVDERGWLLMQERNEHAQMGLNKWGLVAGAVEPNESDTYAATSELAEETGSSKLLDPLGDYVMPCSIEVQEGRLAVFTARTSATDATVECFEGRQMVFIAPDEVRQLNLMDSARIIYLDILAAHV